MEKALVKLKNAWKAHEREIIVFAGVFLVGVIGFETGLVEGQSIQSKPLVVEVPVRSEVSQSTDDQSYQSESARTTDTPSPSKNREELVIDKKCAFVGSKNSNKYHVPTCSFAKRIKPENKVCFASEEDARSKGYQAGCLK